MNKMMKKQINRMNFFLFFMKLFVLSFFIKKKTKEKPRKIIHFFWIIKWQLNSVAKNWKGLRQRFHWLGRQQQTFQPLSDIWVQPFVERTSFPRNYKNNKAKNKTKQNHSIIFHRKKRNWIIILDLFG